MLLDEIEFFINKYNIKPTVFGICAAKSGNFVMRLREGGGYTNKVEYRVKEFMESVENDEDFINNKIDIDTALKKYSCK